jgi:hypothetical protein
MLLKITICKNILYDTIQEYVNNSTDKETKIKGKYYFTNGIPIKYGDNYYIVVPLGYLELSLINNINSDINYDIEYMDTLHKGNILIKKFHSVHNLNFDSESYSDSDSDSYIHQLRLNGLLDDNICFYDEHIKIMFIKFQDVHIEYIEIPITEKNNLVNIPNNKITISYTTLNKTTCLS